MLLMSLTGRLSSSLAHLLVQTAELWCDAQVVHAADKPKLDPAALSLVEVGPRLCLNPVRIFGGSFGGPTLYDNAAYVSPNVLRAALRTQRAGKYTQKVQQRARRREHKARNPKQADALAGVFRRDAGA